MLAIKDTIKDAVEKYQCPGCVNGCDISCFEKEDYSDGCGKHYPGTIGSGIGTFYLGMPKGFNRRGPQQDMKIYVWENQPPEPYYDRFNIPVWKYNDNGNILVRGLMPRVNIPFLHIIINGDINSIDCYEITQTDLDDMD